MYMTYDDFFEKYISLMSKVNELTLEISPKVRISIFMSIGYNLGSDRKVLIFDSRSIYDSLRTFTDKHLNRKFLNIIVDDNGNTLCDKMAEFTRIYRTNRELYDRFFEEHSALSTNLSYVFRRPDENYFVMHTGESEDSDCE